jgi:hypothetical protein
VCLNDGASAVLCSELEGRGTPGLVSDWRGGHQLAGDRRSSTSIYRTEVAAMDVASAEQLHHPIVVKEEKLVDPSGEEDVVVRELDVCVSSALDLYLLQLPLKPCYIDTPNIYEAKMKPNSKVLEVVGDDTIPKLSSTSVTPRTSLGLGIVKNNKLHITGGV